MTAETGDGKLTLSLDAVGTRIVVHSDGSVLIEGKQGIVIDAATANLELKGKKISITATNGVSMSGGAGAVDVDTQTALSLNGATVKVNAKATGEFKAGGPNIITGAPVKIN